MTPAHEDQALVDLQSKLAYLEVTLDALNDQVVSQNARIEALAGALERLSARLNALPSAGESSPEPPPPHY